MAKSHLHLAKTPSNNRRAFLKSGVAATAALTLAQSAVAAPTVSRSEHGRAILKMIAAQRAAMAKEGAYDAAGDEASKEIWAERWLEIADQIEARGREINSRPITSLSDIIDRAILAAYDCDAEGTELSSREDGQMIVSLIEGLVALGGLSVAECHFAI